MKTKQCGGCGEVKSVNDFAFRKKSKDGRQASCRVCLNEYNIIRNRLIKEGDWVR